MQPDTIQAFRLHCNSLCRVVTQGEKGRRAKGGGPECVTPYVEVAYIAASDEVGELQLHAEYLHLNSWLMT